MAHHRGHGQISDIIGIGVVTKQADALSRKHGSPNWLGQESERLLKRTPTPRVRELSAEPNQVRLTIEGLKQPEDCLA